MATPRVTAAKAIATRDLRRVRAKAANRNMNRYLAISVASNQYSCRLQPGDHPRGGETAQQGHASRNGKGRRDRQHLDFNGGAKDILAYESGQPETGRHA